MRLLLSSPDLTAANDGHVGLAVEVDLFELAELLAHDVEHVLPAPVRDVLDGDHGTAYPHKRNIKGSDPLILRRCDCIALREEGEGRSRFGGDGPLLADAPELTFIAALDLSELPRLDPLPAEGTLHFTGTSRSMIWSGWTSSSRRVSCTIRVPRPRTRPAHRSPGRSTGGDDFPHQLLGTSRDIQGPVLDEIPYWFTEGFPATRERYSEAELRGEGWTLLAQFASGHELMFGDMGDLYYVLPRPTCRRSASTARWGSCSAHSDPALEELALDGAVGQRERLAVGGGGLVGRRSSRRRRSARAAWKRW